MDSEQLQLNVGCNFDPALLDGLADLNVRYANGPARVTDLYGSVPSVNPIGTARPRFRLQDLPVRALREFVERASAGGFGMNYTLNVSFVDPRELDAHLPVIRNCLDLLGECGIRRLIVAHPLVAELIARESVIPIELSTILQLRHPRQLVLLKKRCATIQSLCLDVFMNRDLGKLRQFQELARKLDLGLEVIVNEFCVYECPDRNQCYDLHGLDLSQAETKLFNKYPMGRCIALRINEPLEWLYARFILPQWMAMYANRFSIARFKITGRTHPTPYILRVTEAYLRGHYDGNLLELWADVENIGKLAEEYRQPRIHIACDALPDFPAFYLPLGPAPSLEQEHAFLRRAYQAASR